MLQRTKAAVDARKLETSLRKTILCLYCNVYGISVFGTHIYYNFFSFSLKGNFRQSRTKVLTHLNKPNAFFRRPSVISKTVFLSIAKPPLPLFNVEIHFVDTVT